MENEPMKSKHGIEFNINHGVPLLFVGIGAIFIEIFLWNMMYIEEALGFSLGFSMQPKKLKVDEDLPNFLTAVRLA